MVRRFRPKYPASEYDFISFVGAIREEIQKDIDRGHLNAREFIVELKRTPDLPYAAG